MEKAMHMETVNTEFQFCYQLPDEDSIHTNQEEEHTQKHDENLADAQEEADSSVGPGKTAQDFPGLPSGGDLTDGMAPHQEMMTQPQSSSIMASLRSSFSSILGRSAAAAKAQVANDSSRAENLTAIAAWVFGPTMLGAAGVQAYAAMKSANATERAAKAREFANRAKEWKPQTTDNSVPAPRGDRPQGPGGNENVVESPPEVKRLAEVIDQQQEVRNVSATAITSSAINGASKRADFGANKTRVQSIRSKCILPLPSRHNSRLRQNYLSQSHLQARFARDFHKRQ
ncbi:uncharacterized protein FFB20_14234 [Fusarium fujikuroi]|uniref:Uncharacterized protein n=1 Tax=Gibberella fujikuroi (strain CBS 195.34 / IMI 58289 / NRRL A-6831) TaxID=1279085 RepID=S0E5L4_GIBF5|nr:uncharacterized protein FFUJ_14729 [Fusarium fujikuroi IMI 58289]KLO82907.1 uncharacterized protein Y057_882 [Fusarium fujikuroi]KLP14728.1 uncharacterized protein LW94_12430 [Fusarium fujikuroi]CCT67888.1 uncharacterized protein FFUJ_14729 [Fusarium fujikuroi IMI 58289]SCN89041.1 uncharacterized protein FFC1_05637 [Fusarium fujikuroi]SCN93471.1 uncharacterized protein FFE2_07730 [Fusarium fujikuroi]